MAHLTLDFVLDSLSRQVATSVKYIIIPRGSRSHLFTEVALQIVASVADLIWVFLPTGSHDGRAGGRPGEWGRALSSRETQRLSLGGLYGQLSWKPSLRPSPGRIGLAPASQANREG